MKSFFIQKLNSKRKYKVSYLTRWVNRYIWNAACRSNVTLRQMKRTHNLMKHFVFSFFDQGCQVVIAGSALIGSPALIFSREVAASRWDHSLSYYWKDTRLTVYIWQPFEARIIETWRPNSETPGLHFKYWDPRSAAQILRPKVYISITETRGLSIWTTDLGS